MNANRRAHVCDYNNMNNGRRYFNMWTFKKNFKRDWFRQQTPMCSRDLMSNFLCHNVDNLSSKDCKLQLRWTVWQESLMKSCIDSHQIILFPTVIMIGKGFCDRNWTQWESEIRLRMTTSRKTSIDSRIVTYLFLPQVFVYFLYSFHIVLKYGKSFPCSTAHSKIDFLFDDTTKYLIIINGFCQLNLWNSDMHHFISVPENLFHTFTPFIAGSSDETSRENLTKRAGRRSYSDSDESETQ